MLSWSIIKFRIFWSFDILLYPLSFNRFSNNNISLLWSLNIKINWWWRNNWCSRLCYCFNSSTSDYWLNNWLIVRVVCDWFLLSNKCACSWGLINNVWCVIIDNWSLDDLSSDLISIWISVAIVVFWIISLSRGLAIILTVKLWSNCLSLYNSYICRLSYDISVSWNWLLVLTLVN